MITTSAEALDWANTNYSGFSWSAAVACQTPDGSGGAAAAWKVNGLLGDEPVIIIVKENGTVPGYSSDAQTESAAVSWANSNVTGYTWNTASGTDTPVNSDSAMAAWVINGVLVQEPVIIIVKKV